MSTEREIIQRGCTAVFDLPITDSNGDVVNINEYPDWDVVFVLEGSSLPVRKLSEKTLNRTADGKVRIEFNPNETKAIDPRAYKPWAKVYDSDANEWPLIEGTPLFQFKANPIEDL